MTHETNKTNLPLLWQTVLMHRHKNARLHLVRVRHTDGYAFLAFAILAGGSAALIIRIICGLAI